MAKVKIYTTSTCPWCKAAKEFMKENKPGFWEVRGYHIRGDIYKEERYI